MIGIFDSGVGGLTILRRLRERLPHHDFLYLADQAHVPYGDKTNDELAGYLVDNLGFLNAAGADAIVVGCNSSCGIASERGWPRSRAPILDLIESAASAVAQSGAIHVGVLATSATVRSGAYTRAIRKRLPGAIVEEVAAPKLVPLVEAGITGDAALAAVRESCEVFSAGIQRLVLACTHYPVLEPSFAQLYGIRVPRIDPAVVHAQAAEALVGELGLPPGRGTVRYATTGEPRALAAAVRTIIGEANPEVVQCTLEPAVRSSRTA
jgi:glutamate racemase